MKLSMPANLIAISLLALLVGCFTFPKKEFPSKKYHVLEFHRKLKPVESKNGIILSIPALKISPPFNRREFIYRKGASEYESDFYNEFISAPDVLITEQLRQWFYNSGLIETIALSNSHVPPSHFLQGNITTLYADYRNPNALKANAGLRIMLVDDTEIEAKIIFQKGYQIAVNIAAKNPKDLISGWNQGFQQIFTELESDLSQLPLNTHKLTYR